MISLSVIPQTRRRNLPPVESLAGRAERGKMGRVSHRRHDLHVCDNDVALVAQVHEKSIILHASDEILS
jgi:hypothetical protein